MSVQRVSQTSSQRVGESGSWLKPLGYEMDHPSFYSVSGIFYCPIYMSRQGVGLGWRTRCTRPIWHAERFPWPAAFTADPILYSYFYSYIILRTNCMNYRCYQITLQWNNFTQIGTVRSVDWIFDHLKSKRRPLYLKIQPVPRSKHLSSPL